MSRPVSVVIVGAGFGGLGLAIRLRRAGVHDVTVLEKAGRLGGKSAARVHVFQRTPPYVIDKADRPYTPWERRLLRWLPALRRPNVELVTSFPNLFLVYGPNTNLGHSSIIYMLESRFAYITGCVRALSRVRHLDVRPGAQAAFTHEVQRRLRNTVWAGGCASWYLNEAGKIVNNWPSFTFAYRHATHRPDPRDFHVTE